MFSITTQHCSRDTDERSENSEHTEIEKVKEFSIWAQLSTAIRSVEKSLSGSGRRPMNRGVLQQVQLLLCDPSLHVSHCK